MTAVGESQKRLPLLSAQQIPYIPSAAGGLSVSSMQVWTPLDGYSPLSELPQRIMVPTSQRKWRAGSEGDG